MSTAEMRERISEASPHTRDKFVIAYYLLTILTGVFVLFFHGQLAFVADLTVGGFYVLITMFLYLLSK